MGRHFTRVLILLTGLSLLTAGACIIKTKPERSRRGVKGKKHRKHRKYRKHKKHKKHKKHRRRGRGRR